MTDHISTLLRPALRAIFLALFAAGSLAAVGYARAWLAPSDIEQMATTRGALVAQDPRQTEIDGAGFGFSRDGYHLTPVALFDATGVVLGRRGYPTGSDYPFSTLDLALGWGRLSDPSVLEGVTFYQGHRKLRWKIRKGAEISAEEVLHRSANIHIIAADPEVSRALQLVQTGDLIGLAGFLVNAHDGSRVWRTSLARNDTGEGSTEIMVVQSVDLDPLRATSTSR